MRPCPDDVASYNSTKPFFLLSPRVSSLEIRVKSRSWVLGAFRSFWRVEFRLSVSVFNEVNEVAGIGALDYQHRQRATVQVTNPKTESEEEERS